MDSAAEAAIGSGDDVFAADRLGGVSDHAWNEDLAVRQFYVAPDLVLVLMTHVAGFDRIGLRLHAQHDLDDVAQRQVRDVRSVPAAPADMEANAVLGNSP